MSLHRDPLRAKLSQVFGENTTLAAPASSSDQGLKCLLLVVTKNVTTDSPWPISSNPYTKYNDPTKDNDNLKIPLWQLVRTSTAAPVYFPPEILQWNPDDASETFVFADGGVTPYNNPAFLLYRMATAPAYRLNWKTGEKNLLLISIGTGTAESKGAIAAALNKNIVSTVAGLPGETHVRNANRPGHQLPYRGTLHVRRTPRQRNTRSGPAPGARGNDRHS